MVHVKSNEVYASLMTLVLAIVSGILSLFVVLSVHMHPKSKESYHLRIVYNLLLVDVLLSGAVVFYYVMQYLLSSRQLNTFCHYYLPSVIYLFLASFSFTIMFALRFRTMKKKDNVNKIVTWKPPIPFGRLWVFPLIYVIPLLIFAYTLPNVTKVFANDSDTDQSCTFDHDYTTGTVLDLVYFEIPCMLCIIINIYSYSKGLIALKNAPHSVLGRQMRRAGGYLSVLLIVWIPNIIYNFLSIFTSRDYASFLNLCVVLSSSQGLLNVCVYVWSDPGLRRFVRRNAFCRKYFLKKPPLDPNGITRDSTSHMSGMLRNSNVVRPASHRRYTDDSTDDSGADSRQDYEGIDTKTMSASHLSDLTISNQSTLNSQSTQNPLMMAANRSSVALSTEYRRSDETGPKSILMPKSRFSLKKEVSSSVGDLDQEKFVRFGETSTRIISNATTDTRPSERESLNGRPQDDLKEGNSPSSPQSYQRKNLNGETKDSQYGKGVFGAGVLEEIEEEYDEHFYDSDEGDDDLDVESNFKPRDSSHKIFHDLMFKSKLSKEENGNGAANIANDSSRGYVPPLPTPHINGEVDDGVGWKVVNL